MQLLGVAFRVFLISLIVGIITVGNDLLDHYLYPWQEVAPGIAERKIPREDGITWYIADASSEPVIWSKRTSCPKSSFIHFEDSLRDRPDLPVEVIPCPTGDLTLVKDRQSVPGEKRSWRWHIWFWGAPQNQKAATTLVPVQLTPEVLKQMV